MRKLKSKEPVILELQKLLTQLKQTSGRRIARRNARSKFRKALHDFWKDADVCYPPIRKDGTEIMRKKKRGVMCPACRAPMKSFRQLAEHASIKHGCRTDSVRRIKKCWCGKTFSVLQKTLKVEGAVLEYNDKSLTKFARHLAGVGRENLEAHCVIGSLGEKHE